MTLEERAKDFVENGHPRDELRLLAECVRARSLDGLVAVQRLFEDMYGGITFNYEMKAPAAACLICWGKEGIKALVEPAECHKASGQENKTCGYGTSSQRIHAPPRALFLRQRHFA